MKLLNLFKTKKQLIPFLTCGFPTKKDTVDIIKLLLDEGIRIIEIGIPFSDPVADGPTIQFSSYVALKNKITINDVFEVVDKTLNYAEYFPVLMGYLNPAVIYGMERFIKDAKNSGVKGMIFADSIVEEKDIFYQLTKKYGICSIFLLSTTTKLERRRLIYKFTEGFIYLITLKGTTGAKEKLPEEFYKFVKIVRKETEHPLCAGFGISKPQQILPVLEYIDGFIVGSVIIEHLKQDSTYRSLRNFIREFMKIL
ncbi:MAG: tryptophan synthase subunit alpha [Endomicrobiia bacterium]